MDEKIFELHNLLRDEDLSSDADEVKELLEDPESAVQKSDDTSSMRTAG